MRGDPRSEKPLVSVLLPVRDAAATLSDCLRSVRRQTEERWECVIVDDGSRDRSAVIARRFAALDGRFRLAARPRAGLVAALNAGLELCRGPFVARMDADDLMHRSRLAEQLALLQEDPELTATGCHVRIFPRRLVGPGLLEYEHWINAVDGPATLRREAFVECPLAHPTLTIRREPLREVGYRAMGWAEDYDLVLRLLGAGHRIGVLPRRRLLWRHGPGRLSRRAREYAAERFTECKAHFLARALLAGGDRFILWGYGGTGRALCAALERHGKRPSHIIEMHPGRLGNRIRGAPVLPPEALQQLPRAPLLVSVAGAGPRTEIRAALDALGLIETRDYVCCA
jgi:glycosyltransferase involved in cell wall biosynthesis